MLTFNAVSFVRDAIESVLSQEVEFAVELIIGDDCSTDGTRAIILEYVERYPHVIRAHLHERHGAGVPGRVNNMHNLADCRGEYIALLDGDDYFVTADNLARRVAFLDANPRYSSCASNAIHFTPHRHWSQLDPSSALGRGGDLTLDGYLASGNASILGSAMIFRRALLLPLPEWFDEVLLADHYMILLLLHEGPCHFIDERLWAYRLHDGSFNALVTAWPEGVFRYFDDYVMMRRLIPSLAESPALDFVQIQMLIAVAAGSVRRREPSVLPGVWRRLRGFPLLRTLRVMYTVLSRAARTRLMSRLRRRPGIASGLA